MKNIKLNEIEIGNDKPFVLIAGPCVIENRDLNYSTAVEIKNVAARLNIPFIYKSSFKKANRTSLNSFTGMDSAESLEILKEIKKDLNLSVVTDIHKEEDAAFAAQVADVLQIPAFLCRQTDLLLAAGNTGKIVNIKKGQFLAPTDMKHAAVKVESTGNKNVMFTERGTTFGYNNLVVDMRSLVIMGDFGYPVVMDATHSVQMPGQDGITGGNPRFIKYLAKAAASVGIAALFLEVHPDPANAMSDAASQLPLDELEILLKEVMAIDKITKSY